MNRKKKINKIYNKRRKEARAKNQPNAKSRYISKADRAALENDDNQSTLNQDASSNASAAG